VNVISMTWTDAPTGFSGSGGVDVRPAVCGTALGGGVLTAPKAAAVQGTGLPVFARLRQIDELGAIRVSYLRGAAGIAPISTTKNDDQNTLGIHPPGRPQS
jgi:hypothetical protein